MSYTLPIRPNDCFSPVCVWPVITNVPWQVETVNHSNIAHQFNHSNQQLFCCRSRELNYGVTFFKYISSVTAISQQDSVSVFQARSII